MSPPSASRFPTVAEQLYQLASGATTSVELVRRALRAIDAGDAAAVLDRWVSVTRSLAGRD